MITTVWSPCGSGSTRRLPTSTCRWHRRELIPNLVETVKGYVATRTTLDAAISARNAAIASSEGRGRAGAAEACDRALRPLFALAEAYPDLEANQIFLELQTELSAIEDKVAAARRFYNAAVQDTTRHRTVPRGPPRAPRILPRNSSTWASRSAR